MPHIVMSIHAPGEGRDLSMCEEMVSEGFQSTRPVKGATFNMRLEQDDYEISIHAPGEGRD